MKIKEYVLTSQRSFIEVIKERHYNNNGTKLTDQALADLLGVSRITAGKYKLGKIMMPIDLLVGLSVTYGLSLDYIKSFTMLALGLKALDGLMETMDYMFETMLDDI